MEDRHSCLSLFVVKGHTGHFVEPRIIFTMIPAAKRLLVCALLLAGCSKRPELPVNTMLWRVDREWAPVGDSRTATVTLISFRASGEFVELHAWVLERPDTAVYIVSDRPRVAAVGKWTREDDVVTATRTQVSPAGKAFCTAPPITFRITATSVSGNVGGAGEGIYSPITRLVMPAFESYIQEAKHLCNPAPAKD